jgi:YD repeat-containing protein
MGLLFPRKGVLATNIFGFALLVAACLGAGGGALAANGSVIYTYDALGRIATASYDTGVFVIYTYDANGNRLSQIVNVNTTTLVWGSGKWGQTLW